MTLHPFVLTGGNEFPESERYEMFWEFYEFFDEVIPPWTIYYPLSFDGVHRMDGH